MFRPLVSPSPESEVASTVVKVQRVPNPEIGPDDWEMEILLPQGVMPLWSCRDEVHMIFPSGAMMFRVNEVSYSKTEPTCIRLIRTA